MSKTVDLVDPIIGHGGKIEQITLRAPRAKDFWELGEPFQRAGDETLELSGVVGAYVERLVEKPELLPQVSLADALRLRDAVLGFFGDALRRAYPAPATSSSSNSASSPPANAAS